MRYLKMVAPLALVAVLSGCSVFSKPYDAGDPNVASALRVVNAVGKLTCDAVLNEGSAADVANTRVAVDYANWTLDSGAPTYTAIKVVFDTYLPDKYSPYVDITLDEIAAEFGESLVDKESTAFVAVKKLVDGCNEVLTKAGK